MGGEAHVGGLGHDGARPGEALVVGHGQGERVLPRLRERAGDLRAGGAPPPGVGPRVGDHEAVVVPRRRGVQDGGDPCGHVGGRGRGGRHGAGLGAHLALDGDGVGPHGGAEAGGVAPGGGVLAGGRAAAVRARPHRQVRVRRAVAEGEHARIEVAPAGRHRRRGVEGGPQRDATLGGRGVEAHGRHPDHEVPLGREPLVVGDPQGEGILPGLGEDACGRRPGSLPARRVEPFVAHDEAVRIDGRRPVEGHSGRAAGDVRHRRGRDRPRDGPRLGAHLVLHGDVLARTPLGREAGGVAPVRRVGVRGRPAPPRVGARPRQEVGVRAAVAEAQPAGVEVGPLSQDGRRRVEGGGERLRSDVGAGVEAHRDHVYDGRGRRLQAEGAVVGDGEGDGVLARLRERPGGPRPRRAPPVGARPLPGDGHAVGVVGLGTVQRHGHRPGRHVGGGGGLDAGHGSGEHLHRLRVGDLVARRALGREAGGEAAVAFVDVGRRPAHPVRRGPGEDARLRVGAVAEGDVAGVEVALGGSGLGGVEGGGEGRHARIGGTHGGADVGHPHELCGRPGVRAPRVVVGHGEGDVVTAPLREVVLDHGLVGAAGDRGAVHLPLVARDRAANVVGLRAVQGDDAGGGGEVHTRHPLDDGDGLAPEGEDLLDDDLADAVTGFRPELHPVLAGLAVRLRLGAAVGTGLPAAVGVRVGHEAGGGAVAEVPRALGHGALGVRSRPGNAGPGGGERGLEGHVTLDGVGGGAVHGEAEVPHHDRPAGDRGGALVVGDGDLCTVEAGVGVDAVLHGRRGAARRGAVAEGPVVSGDRAVRVV